MSLLEDVFLEDEAGEAQELERIIEGDEYDDRPRPSTPNSNENSEKEDEAEEDKRMVDPTAKPKHVVKNPRFILNPARLTGPRGIQLIPDHFKDFKFKGKGHEKDDLDLVLKKLEHWAYRLYPKFQFEDCLKKIETLGRKRPVMVHLQKIRSDQLSTEEPVVQKDSSDDDDEAPQQQEDEFDKLLQQQIELARATPAPSSVRKLPSTPVVDKSHMMPKATSSPSISEDQRQRMIRNRQLAEERRLAKLKQNELTKVQETEVTENNELKANDGDNNCGVIGKSNYEVNSNINISKSDERIESTISIQENDDDDEINDISKSKNRSNIIDSSDEEESIVMNESIQVDIHENRFSNSDEKSVDEKTSEECRNVEINDNNIEESIVNEDIQIETHEIRNTISEEKNSKEKVHDKNAGLSNVNDLTDKSKDDKCLEIDETNQSSEIRSVEKKGDEIEFENMDVDFTDDF